MYSNLIDASIPFINLKEGEYGITVACSLFLIAFYAVLRMMRPEIKTRAWILSLASSSTMSICGIIYTIRFFNHLNSFGFQNVENFVVSDDDFSRSICIFFKAFLVIDIIIGMIDYRSQVQILSGWLHHFFYAGFLSWILSSNISVGFALVTPLEFPTLFLSLGSVFPSLRTDMAFGLVFLVTRIIYHSFVLWLFIGFQRVTLWPTILGLGILHWFWFFGWVKSMNKKRRGLKNKVDAEPIIESNSISEDHKVQMKQFLSNETKQD